VAAEKLDALLRRPPRTVASADGTVIAYFTTGRGPPVIVAPGVLSAAADFALFADVLGRTHAVHTIERRGRGSSGPQGEGYGMAKECEDVAALQVATGAQFLFGHSYGGLIALEAARTSRVFRRLAVYEPGVSVAGSIDLEWTLAYERRLAQAKPLDAFAIFSVGAGPRRARSLPVWLMKLLAPVFIGAADRRRMFDLLPANLLEHQVIARLDSSYPGYRNVQAEVLVMHGGRSDLEWVVAATKALSSVLPSVVVRGFPKLDHFGPAKTGPREVASAVGAFFSSHVGVSE
jgi:pimeloyl-ACP methyl ester carboxylesterase